MKPRKQAKRLRKQGKSLSQIAAALDVSPQIVSIAIDPAKQAAPRAYVKAWKERRYQEPEFREHQQEMDRAMKREKRETDPGYRQPPKRPGGSR